MIQSAGRWTGCSACKTQAHSRRRTHKTAISQKRTVIFTVWVALAQCLVQKNCSSLYFLEEQNTVITVERTSTFCKFLAFSLPDTHNRRHSVRTLCAFSCPVQPHTHSPLQAPGQAVPAKKQMQEGLSARLFHTQGRRCFASMRGTAHAETYPWALILLILFSLVF